MAATPDNTAMSTLPKTALPTIAAVAKHLKDPYSSKVDLNFQTTRFTTNRLTISLHSSVLAKVCAEQAVKPSHGYIELSTHLHRSFSQRHIKAMVIYMSKLSYDVPWEDRGSGAEFHVQMVALAEELDVKGLVNFATAKFKSVLDSTAITPQTAIKIARLAFGHPDTLPSIRAVFTAYADGSSSSLAILCGTRDRPCLSLVGKPLPVEVETDRLEDSWRFYHTLVLTSSSLPNEEDTKPNHSEEAKESYKCVRCGAWYRDNRSTFNGEQWRSDVKDPDKLYRCEGCGLSMFGWALGIRAEDAEVEDGQMFTCLGCDEKQMRSNIPKDEKVYDCDWCGWEETGWTWWTVKEAGEEDI